ncbi:hypothetical protein LPJ56_007228, partial [Coemansia sp. RSA 2599]
MVFDNGPTKTPEKQPASDKGDGSQGFKRQRVEPNTLEIADTKMALLGQRSVQAEERRPASVICARARTLAKRMVACPGGSGNSWLVEHVSGQLSLIKSSAGELATATTLVASDVAYAWWIDRNTAGVVCRSSVDSGVFLHAVDCVEHGGLADGICDAGGAIARLDGDDGEERRGSRKSLFPGTAVGGPMAAKGDVLVCASSDGFLRAWRIGRDVSGKCVSTTCYHICLSSVLGGDGDQERAVVDLRWTAEG